LDSGDISNNSSMIGANYVDGIKPPIELIEHKEK
jgi:hypothetical protein